MNLANKLTIFRMILVPIFVLIGYIGIPGETFGIYNTFLVMNLIFIIASITDKLDGTIARATNQITTFGKFLEPIADKILVLAALIILVEFNKIPAWIPILILFREFIVSGYRLIASQKGGSVIAASVWGKLKTVTQMIAIIMAYIDVGAFCQCFSGELSGSRYIINLLTTIFILISIIATVFSGIDYLKGGKDLLKDK